MKKRIIGILCAAFGLVLFAGSVAAQVNNPPSKASIPRGALVGNTQYPYTYQSKATDSDGDKVKITFNWGDGTSTTTGLVSSGEWVSATHQWPNKEIGGSQAFNITAKATDEHGMEGAWSTAFPASMVTHSVNNPPTIPSFSGPSSGMSGTAYRFSLVSTDPDGNKIKYFIHWGDSTSNTDYFSSGQVATVSHSWTVPAGETRSYSITAYAVDEGNARLPYPYRSTPLVITIKGTGAGTGADTAKPTVSITEPANSTSYTSAQTVVISANASDNVDVKKVEFYIDGTLKFTDTASPHMYAWNTADYANGIHTLTAKAYDAAGNNTTSAAVSVTVNIPVADAVKPTVSITSPANNASYSTAQTVVINAVANDNVGVTKVEFYENGNLLETDTTSGYSYSWQIAPGMNGTHSLTAKAYDAAGNNTVSVAVSVTVNIVATDTTKPVITLIAPTANTTVSGIVYVNAVASDNVGVSRVEFYVDGVRRMARTLPYVYIWDTKKVTNGIHTITTKAYDNAGNVSVSLPISVTVKN